MTDREATTAKDLRTAAQLLLMTADELEASAPQRALVVFSKALDALARARRGVAEVQRNLRRRMQLQDK